MVDDDTAGIGKADKDVKLRSRTVTLPLSPIK